MIRVLAFMVRRPDLTRDQFRDHYERTHVPTALPILAGTTHYVRHHIRDELFGKPNFDCMTAFEYRDAAAMRAVFAKSEGAGGERVRADELRFMDKPANFFFGVDEADGWGDAPPSEGLMTLLVCVRRAAAASPADARARFASVQLPALRAAIGGAPWGRVAYARAGSPREKSFDAVVLCSASGAGDLLVWCRAAAGEGADVLALRVTSHATQVAG
jgi:hypothetical protein